MSAGVGGGGILVPIFNLVQGLHIKQSTALAQAVIAASGLGSAAYSLTHPHPHIPSQPLVDLTLVLVLTPSLLLGIAVGVLLNAISPPILIIIAIVTVLSTMAYRTFKVANRLKSLEHQAAALEALRWSAEDAERGSDCVPDQLDIDAVAQVHHHHGSVSGVGAVSGAVSVGGATASVGSGGGSRDSFLRRRQLSTRPQLNWTQITQLLVLWSLFSAIHIEKARNHRCTIPYAVSYVLQIIIAVVGTWYFARQATAPLESDTTTNSNNSQHSSSLLREPLLRGMEEDSNGGGTGGTDTNNTTTGVAAIAQHHMSTTVLSKRRLTTATTASVGAGVVAGVIGMGGGFLLNPLLLEFGVHPQVAAATSSFMVLFSSASATVAFAADGRLDPIVAIVFGVTCCISSFVGVYFLAKVVKKRGASTLVFLLGTVISVGVVATALFDGHRIYKQIMDGRMPEFSFRPFCHPYPQPPNITDGYGGMK